MSALTQLDFINHSKLHPTVPGCFPEQLVVVDTVTLVNVDADLKSLYDFFSRYQNYTFSAQERILVFHPDTDYYPSVDGAGNTVFNLIQIIADLDISTDHLIILTNTIGLKKEIVELCDQTNLSCPTVIDFTLWYVYPDQLPAHVANTEPKEYLFSCLNGIKKSHRSTMIGLLHQHDLMGVGIVSYNPHSTATPVREERNQIDQGQQHPLTLQNRFLRTTLPFTRYNDDMSNCVRSKQLQTTYSQYLASPIKHQLIVGAPNSPGTRFFVPFLQKALVYVITETVGNYPYAWFSEKTWKSMSSKLPFMLLGPPHSLKTLKNFGFKTFSDFWNEDYDNLPNTYDRAQVIVKNLVGLKSVNWNQLHQELLPILDYNFEHLFAFQQHELNKIKNLL